LRSGEIRLCFAARGWILTFSDLSVYSSDVVSCESRHRSELIFFKLTLNLIFLNGTKIQSIPQGENYFQNTTQKKLAYGAVEEHSGTIDAGDLCGTIFRKEIPNAIKLF